MKMPLRCNSCNETQSSSVYPEFADRGIVSLVAELRKLVEEEVQAKNGGELGKESDDYAGSPLNLLRQVAVDIQDNIIFEGKERNEFLPIYIDFRKRIMLGRWNKLFPYVDCSETKIFC